MSVTIISKVLRYGAGLALLATGTFIRFMLQAILPLLRSHRASLHFGLQCKFTSCVCKDWKK